MTTTSENIAIGIVSASWIIVKLMEKRRLEKIFRAIKDNNPSYSTHEWLKHFKQAKCFRIEEPQ